MKSIMTLIALCGCIISIENIYAQENAQDSPSSTPEKVIFGIVRIGATVEASICVDERQESAFGISLNIDVPKFVNVTKVVSYSRKFDDKTRLIRCVTFSIDTSTLGHYEGPIRVQLSKNLMEIPVSVDITERALDDTRILIVDTPFNGYAGNSECLAPWRDLLTKGHFDCNYLEVSYGFPILRERDLSKVDVILIGDGGTHSIQDLDLEKLKRFIKDGGRVIIAASEFMPGSVEHANKLTMPFGLKFLNDECFNNMVDSSAFDKNPLLNDIRNISFKRGSPIVLGDQAKGTILVPSPRFSKAGFVMMATEGTGDIVALGDSLWWDWIGEKKADCDNQLLFRRLISRPHKDNREKTPDF